MKTQNKNMKGGNKGGTTTPHKSASKGHHLTDADRKKGGEHSRGK
ncbi:Uncharacterised protein [Legionella wadsworthii]|uniref:Uncharacterized protein n=1 Tax=Legionella wadsworthii TaxID=28088 RepID=A0A378LT12_9GAMM|nr:hypothetical protein [Legionella wadsworthii]STY30243.1 Uncharacterised protein [Legionella wadsworthii]